MILRSSIGESACVSFLHDAKDRRTLVVYQEDGLKVSISLTAFKCKFSSCKKIVLWACCQRNSDHVCSECTTHAARCSDCGGSVCRGNCFWGLDMGVNLCSRCGQYCSQCSRVVHVDEMFKCSNYPCAIDEVCLNCAVGATATCADCEENFCEQCVEDAGVRCDGCNQYFCDNCNDSKMCDECSEHFCSGCSENEIHPHPKWKDDPSVFICSTCLVEYDHDMDP